MPIREAVSLSVIWHSFEANGQGGGVSLIDTKFACLNAFQKAHAIPF